MLENIKEKFKHFKPTTWSIRNKTSIYLLMLFVSLGGIYQFISLPKERFPDVVIPYIYVQTIYVGNSPKDIENLVTKPIEKQIKGITGAKVDKVTSTSQQDYSAILVQFSTDVKTDIALQKVKDAVDKSKTDLGKIEGAITAAGYDANDKKADPEAYKELDDCCKLPKDRK